MQFAENLRNPQKRMLARPGCNPESLYGEVHSRQTSHFIIYYTTTGPHRVKTLAYIDSLASYLEQAYKLHKDVLGMKEIRGVGQTYQYRQNVPAKLYPVEVIETGLLRDNEGMYESPLFGLTMPSSNRLSRATQIAIENDFLYGADCSGRESGNPFVSSISHTDYSVKWHLALKVTTFHELYHAFQLTYFDWVKYDTFWLEASATGTEEIGAPEVDDYINYLPSAFRNPGKSMEASEYGYAYATLYLFLHHKFGAKFDSHIWDSFSKNPNLKFSTHLAMLANSHGIDAEELFHEYASSIFFSGHRAAEAPQESIWQQDQHKWPEWSTHNMLQAPRVLPATAIDFVKTVESKIGPRTDSAKISLLEYGDSSIWVLSRLLEREFIPSYTDTFKEFAAYPNPWNPRKNPAAKFGNLPINAKGVEIRSANGTLIERIPRKPENEEPLSWQPKKLPAPGIIYYRAFPHGKNKVLIVEW